VAGRPSRRRIHSCWIAAILGLATLPSPSAAQVQGGRPLPSAPQPAAAASAAAGGTVPSTVGSAAAEPSVPQPPLSDAQLRQLLRSADLEQLEPLCIRFLAEGNLPRLRLVGQRLLTINPAPQPPEVLLANAEVLLRCRLPAAAMAVLDRLSPEQGAERVQWLVLQWRAAEAALDPQRAAQALERLAAGDPTRLAGLQLPVRQREDGSWVSRPALELLLAALEAAGRPREAASLLLLSADRDGASAERLAQALDLWRGLPPEQREPVMERALEQAAAAGSWGLVSDLLAAQAVSATSPEALARNRERRLRLSRRLDDAYDEWRALPPDPSAARRRGELERQLRSPRSPGGHAAALPLPPRSSSTVPIPSSGPAPVKP